MVGKNPDLPHTREHALGRTGACVNNVFCIYVSWLFHIKSVLVAFIDCKGDWLQTINRMLDMT